MVFFEAPHRLADSLLDCVNVFGPDRQGAICREMTKRYEETIRGNLKELSSWATSNEVLGEITLVIAGAVTDSASLTAADMVARVREFESAGMDRKGAIATVADEFGIAKRLVYAAVVDANKMSQ
jgi:16S rRNA (cytidine1402-2'-O)-methyltransferase